MSIYEDDCYDDAFYDRVYSREDDEDPEPDCECTQIDVDLFDARTCELHNPRQRRSPLGKLEPQLVTLEDLEEQHSLELAAIKSDSVVPRQPTQAETFELPGDNPFPEVA